MKSGYSEVGWSMYGSTSILIVGPLRRNEEVIQPQILYIASTFDITILAPINCFENSKETYLVLMPLI